jgi:uncharacterized protein (DUF1778 family)
MARPAPNRNPRVYVTFSPETYALLAEASALTGTPKSALVSELMDAALPAVKATLEALRVVNEQPREAQRLMSNFAAKASMDVAQQQLELDAAIDARTMKGKRAKREASRGRATS